MATAAEVSNRGCGLWGTKEIHCVTNTSFSLHVYGVRNGISLADCRMRRKCGWPDGALLCYLPMAGKNLRVIRNYNNANITKKQNVRTFKFINAKNYFFNIIMLSSMSKELN